MFIFVLKLRKIKSLMKRQTFIRNTASYAIKSQVKNIEFLEGKKYRCI